MDFLSPPRQLLQQQNLEPQNAQPLLNRVRQSLSRTENQQLDIVLNKRFSSPSSGGSSLSLERKLELTMTPQKTTPISSVR